MTPGQEIVLDDALRRLRLPAMVREWREHARQAKEAGEGYTGFLLALASRELEQRQVNQIQRRLRAARFPLGSRRKNPYERRLPRRKERGPGERIHSPD